MIGKRQGPLSAGPWRQVLQESFSRCFWEESRQYIMDCPTSMIARFVTVEVGDDRDGSDHIPVRYDQIPHSTFHFLSTRPKFFWSVNLKKNENILTKYGWDKLYISTHPAPYESVRYSDSLAIYVPAVHLWLYPTCIFQNLSSNKSFVEWRRDFYENSLGL